MTSIDELCARSNRTHPFNSADRWTLTFRGTVMFPFTLTYPNLYAQPAITEIDTLNDKGYDQRKDRSDAAIANTKS
ncbi:MAG: hypothetical protein NPIRA03_05380 [Nitrospirales bacterium]|nr:MAG: hypothetical protein NPIRA03_05380 [Nitrospirales bacterium]